MNKLWQAGQRGTHICSCLLGELPPIPRDRPRSGGGQLLTGAKYIRNNFDTY